MKDKKTGYKVGDLLMNNKFMKFEVLYVGNYGLLLLDHFSKEIYIEFKKAQEHLLPYIEPPEDVVVSNIINDCGWYTLENFLVVYKRVEPHREFLLNKIKEKKK